MTLQQQEQASPWRRLFEEVRRAAGNRRDEHGVQGSINWLRRQMELRGANPNVVRNIIYRDKGRLADKRVLFAILGELWGRMGKGSLEAPELEVLLSHAAGAESELVQLLGREKRRAYRSFITGVHGGELPKLVITGRPGSGKTLLIDYIQEALEVAPGPADRILRLEFGAGHLATSLTRLAVNVGVPAEVVEAKLVKVGSSGAFAVQADAQAEVARVILEGIRSSESPLILLAHVSRSNGSEDRLGNAPLRLNTPEVPRVSAAEWLWHTLFEPLSRLPGVGLLISMSDLPARALSSMGRFGEPVKLNPPTANEARRFVRARLPDLDAAEQEAVVRRAGRSFEELRTLTLLAELRSASPEGEGSPSDRAHVSQLAGLVATAGEERLRDFLAALAVLSLPEFPTFALEALQYVRDDHDRPASLELAFLDPVPPDPDRYRPFSRQFTRELRKVMYGSSEEHFRSLNQRAAAYYFEGAQADPAGEAASRYLHHLFHARDWTALIDWIERSAVRQSLIRPLWSAAREELGSGETYERVAHQVAWHYVRLGAFEHPEAQLAFSALEQSSSGDIRTWSLVQRAEGAVLQGRIDEAEELLSAAPATEDPLREAEIALVRASIARWRSELDSAAAFTEEVARPRLRQVRTSCRASRLALTKAAFWSGLIAKDRGDLEGALREFESVETEDDLIEARIAFQHGDVLLSLGRFDAALRSLDRAVELSHLGHALVTEQVRYLTRRGTLHRKRGEFDRARHDFERARSAVLASDEGTGESDRRFWLARSDDERALLLLAEGSFQEAILTLERNIANFESYGRQLAVDASYRTLRGTLRLARAYLFRALGVPYRLPYTRSISDVPPGPDLRHAARLVDSVLDALGNERFGRLHWPLRRDAYLLGSLVAGDRSLALDHGLCALAEAACPYHLAEARAHLAAASLRLGEFEAASEHTTAARKALDQVLGEGELGDLGLRAWVAGLELEALLRRGDAEAAGQALRTLLADRQYREYHQALLRIFGEALEDSRTPRPLQSAALGPLLGTGGSLEFGRVRLPDALSAWWTLEGQDPLQSGGA